MKISMARVLSACEALWGLMGCVGLRPAAQLAMLRLWKRLSEAREMYLQAETMLAKEYGQLGEDGKITFANAKDQAAFVERKKELLDETAEIKPEKVEGVPALWAAVTPKTLMALDGLLVLEGGEDA